MARLDKERAKLAGDIDKIDVKLANADFLARAPEEIVDEQRERRDAAEARKRKIEEALARLRAGHDRAGVMRCCVVPARGRCGLSLPSRR